MSAVWGILIKKARTKRQTHGVKFVPKCQDRSLRLRKNGLSYRFISAIITIGKVFAGFILRKTE
ncbi:MAG TPA: hypothetical protein DIW24_04100 [Bacteroidetes bacterium]|nr:hypothetical protein [Bacteroidota bacterium]